MSQITPCCQPAAHTTWPCSCGSFNSAFAFVGENFLRLSTHFCAIFCCWPKAPPQTIRLNLAPNIAILSSKRAVTNCLTSIYYLWNSCTFYVHSMLRWNVDSWYDRWKKFLLQFVDNLCNSTYASIESSCYAAEVSFKRILRNALLLASTWLAPSGQHPHVALQIILQINHFCLHRLSLYITAALLNSKPIMALFALFDFPVGASCNHLQCPTYTCKGKRTHDWSALALSNEKIHQCCCQFNKMMQNL